MSTKKSRITTRCQSWCRRLAEKGKTAGTCHPAAEQAVLCETGLREVVNALQDKFHIGLTKEISKEVSNAFNLSMRVLQKGEIKKTKKQHMNSRKWD